MNESIYYNLEKQYNKQLIRLENEPFSKQSKELIKQFHNHLFTVGAKKLRIVKLTYGLRKICNILEKDLDKTTKTDIERVVANIQNNQQYKESTKSDYKRCLKQFYKWFEDEDPRLQNGDEKGRQDAMKVYKYLRKHVKTTVKTAIVDPGSIIQEEDILKVISKGCRSDMERAFIKLLHETGCRIGELLNIRLKDIQRKKTLWSVRVDGKTGERPRPILDSIPYLLRWLDFHPDKENPDAYLWISMNNRFRDQRINYIGARRLIDRCFERSGIKKKCNPHFFRHSRATLDAPKFSDSIQCQIMGWTQGSRQVARYRHMSGKQAEDAFSIARGIKKVEEEQLPQPIKCVCGRLNEPEAKYCSICGKALTLDTALKEKEYLDKAFEAISNIMSNPELKEQFDKWKANT